MHTKSTAQVIAEIEETLYEADDLTVCKIANLVLTRKVKLIDDDLFEQEDDGYPE